MNLRSRHRREFAAAVVLTLLVVTGVGLIQSARGGWPFSARATTEAIGRAAPAAKGPAAADRAPVEVRSTDMTRLGIRLETARIEDVIASIDSVATVALDESRLSRVNPRVSGWVEQLYVNTTGESVRAGQPVARIFSQELVSSQAEYLAARRFAETGLATSVAASGRTRLQVLGMSEGEIRGIERSGRPIRLVTVTAPRGGIVVNRGVSVGASVDPSTELLTLADLSRVWVFAEAPEGAARAIRPGTPARLQFPSAGPEVISSQVEFVYPTLSERTRTLRVRFSVPNPDRALIPGAYGTAIFDVAGQRAISVPRDAVVDTGRRQHMFVASGAMFEPRQVVVGERVGDRVVILKGLSPGERFVASGTFLLDSESRLRATGGGAHSHGAVASSPPAGGAGKGSDRGPAPSSAPGPHAGHAAPR